MDALRCICKREKTDGERWLTINPIAVNWGDTDDRADWEGVKEFCSFGCLATWAAQLADKWDSRPDLKEETGNGDSQG